MPAAKVVGNLEKGAVAFRAFDNILIGELTGHRRYMSGGLLLVQGPVFHPLRLGRGLTRSSGPEGKP